MQHVHNVKFCYVRPFVLWLDVYIKIKFIFIWNEVITNHQTS